MPHTIREKQFKHIWLLQNANDKWLLTEINTQEKRCITTSLFFSYFSTIKIANISLLIREMMTHSPTKNTPKRETPEPPLRCRHIGPEV